MKFVCRRESIVFYSRVMAVTHSDNYSARLRVVVSFNLLKPPLHAE
jgi:hypothetical protein